MTIMTKRNMPRKPGGKPGKPSKPGKPGKPFERPEGENWVRTQIIWNWKKKQITFISDFSPSGEEQSPNGDPMQGSSEVQLHLPFRHRWVLWPGSSLALINTVIYKIEWSIPWSTFTTFHTAVIIFLDRWSTWRRPSATIGKTLASAQSHWTQRWQKSISWPSALWEDHTTIIIAKSYHGHHHYRVSH